MEAAGTTWVTKTNVTDYLRCPYSFWLLHSRAITRDQLFGPAERSLLDSGVQFESGIVEAAAPIETPPGGILQLFAEDHLLLDVQTLVNDELRLVGRPDGIATAFGRLEPIELKAHKTVTHMDRLELTFYWLLLSALRTAAPTQPPRGWLWVRLPDGSHEDIGVPITPDLLDEARRLIDQVRAARRNSVSPRECRCNVCDVLRGGEVSAALQPRLQHDPGHRLASSRAPHDLRLRRLG